MPEILKEAWDEKQIGQLHADIVTQFLCCEDAVSVNISIEYAKILKKSGLTKDNYPFFMSLFTHENEDFISTLLGDGTIFQSLLELHKNQYLIRLCFELLKRFIPGKVFEKTLETILKVLAANYHSPFAGYRTYPLTIEDLYLIGKFLDKGKPQTSGMNRLILDILCDLGELDSKDIADRQIISIGSQANRVRNGFFDNSLVMDTVMPYSLIGEK